MDTYETIKSADGNDEYRALDLNFKDNHQCVHNFVRRDRRIECTKCGVGYMDDSRDPFPIKELNDFFSDPKSIEYFKTHSV